MDGVKVGYVSPKLSGEDDVSWTEEDDKKEDAVEDDVVSWEVSRT